VVGDVRVNGGRAAAGDTVSSGDVISTGMLSEADVEIRDVSIFHIKENTEVTLENLVMTPRVEVRQGWFLSIIKKKSGFEVATPTVLAGTRGTVLFFNVLDRDRTYMCNCNGRITLYDAGSGRELKNVRSVYHTAFMLSRAGGSVMIERAQLQYHEDPEILRMSERFSRETRVFRERQEESGGGGYSGY
jgi:hypothetical protein